MFVEGIVDVCSTGDAYSKYQRHVYDKNCNQLRLGSIWAPREHKSYPGLFLALNAHMWLRLFSAIIIFTGFVLFLDVLLIMVLIAWDCLFTVCELVGGSNKLY